MLTYLVVDVWKGLKCEFFFLAKILQGSVDHTMWKFHILGEVLGQKQKVLKRGKLTNFALYIGKFQIF
jgi:hypothetical protein